MYELNLEDEVLKYLPLVERVANRISIKNTEYEYGDLYNIGVIGLMDALRKFDATKKVPFESYASIRIKGAIIDEIRKHAKISRYKMTAINRFYHAKQELEQELKREATEKELCAKMKITARQLSEVYENIHFLASVSLEDTLFSHEDGGMALTDILPDNHIVSGEEKLLRNERRQALIASIKRLPEREQLILSLYYKDEATLKEIAQILDISIARVSQIHGKVISKLKGLIKEELK
ncbi:sigma-70 family RNA polymerase sigma factor [Liquorilactobacillus satsumensis]|uniref:sigma-70 family RNA polymerase sigma factor n=1 Tax=Liquorilactobacillus satsumensis TaxID=259059 RepID=UPI001E481249|nr:FliA/WhiG family RNA polymerase sigma factor [Liquorilactobacillus satsumensis]MCC7666606.1 FliA/WhiG family RNA polymerase sigma factor [Liquorilactobacillus satsumensis]MCP9329272.1 FliA/WhiG family RNA polymerase sigma factor [Liquorilactobacillus satsumensis]MCP9357833.1 FliA/WhiG family RNA polymerase sigma factor [Liquorilactobacillus satsumensis]MCP9371573.1 FliA/WhiG family RNA polymerase sigma factor [Liquorilactobacillus satsumensis]